MIIQTRFLLPSVSDWCPVMVDDEKRFRVVDVYVPLAEKLYPDLETTEAVRKVAISRFKELEEIED